MTAEFMSGLDPKKIFEFRQHCEFAFTISIGHMARTLPEGLCTKIAQMLNLLELAARDLQDFRVDKPGLTVDFPRVF